MDFNRNDSFTPQSSTELSIEQEFLINKTLLTHESDGCRVDCKILFQAMENVMLYASNPNKAVDVSTLDGIENFASKETLEHDVYKTSRAILWECHNTADVHMRTIVLLEMLGKYRWDAKVVLLLTAFAISYGEFRLILEVCAHNSLAASLAVLKNLSLRNREALRPQFKAMELLIKEMMELAKCVVRFESLPQQLVLYDDHDNILMASAKSQIYLATYWIFRSSLASASQITDLIAMKQEQVNSNITANAAWGLSSLALKLSRLCSCLRMQVDACQEKIEQILYRKVMELLKVHTKNDNQELFHLFFSLNDDFPLKDSSSSESKVGISRLKGKVVMLLISKPDLSPIDQTLLLLHQTHEHPHHKNIEQDYEIVWVPVSSSETWTLNEHISFDCLSNTLPWLSIRQPWLLNSAIVQIIREEWKFEQEPLIVVLDPQGLVSNYNALDMVLIWGAKAFPFTDSREKELWEDEHWNVKLMLDGIDHFLMKTVELGQNVCICGSSNLEWIKEFESRIKKLKNAGFQLQVIYVGSRNTSEKMQTTLSFFNKENSFTPSKIRLFWLRLEKIKDSIVRVGQIQAFANYENLLKQVSELLDTDDQNTIWAVFGCGSSEDYVKLEGNKITELFDLFPVWAEKVAAYGLVGAIRSAGKEDMSTLVCDHPTMVPFDEGKDLGPVVCDTSKSQKHYKRFTSFLHKEPKTLQKVYIIFTLFEL
ncbi:protein SIEVE ELEMENT OCCLUSION C [Artemisia annua]|uniref:Protein SIEVE ELEMENT OCCLUSION C n=1 Tax=Artemisia annua TaxID=35608 RepID=A0A2U1NTG8_ARTAN|nr:protein SIEVE ELEMENT OCCLUSION C [Artemisia annua]